MAFLEKLLQRIERIDPKRLESVVKALANERDLLEKVFNLLAEGIIVTDRECKVSFINRSAVRMLGAGRSRFEGENILGVIRDRGLCELIRVSLMDQKGFLGREVFLGESTRLLMNANLVILEDEAGAYDGAIILLRDITAERLEQARRSQEKRMKALATLAAGIAHEVGNPLNSLGIHLQLLERRIKLQKQKKEEELLDLLDVANEEVKRLGHIVSQFLKAIRPQQPDLKEGNILEILDGTIDFMAHEIERKGILLKREYDTPSLPVLIDQEGMRQVFINLINNAVQATSAGGIIRIKAGYEEGEVSVGFTDSGCGIPEDQMDRIFEPYFTTKGSGAGLGLMIVERIINQHNGRLIVTSTPGRGTSVTVRLPVPRKYRKLLPSRKSGKKH
jgi:two-component system, sporulation sensor kinase E